ncbi:MAG: type II toxin-antitoxin system PemK/MazF family toxin [Thermodesulfobacteriota bacterium]|nr:type II toxin-antitoxin system PemK/MazF family toxin [Thermodesulfobacteriota bacterium]
MISEGQIVLFKFPQTDQEEGKLRPALVIRKLPGKYDGWLICMISSQIHQQIIDFDIVITSDDPDFEQSGLKLPSVIRISRLAVVDKSILLGKLGLVNKQRLAIIKQRFTNWILDT